MFSKRILRVGIAVMLVVESLVAFGCGSGSSRSKSGAQADAIALLKQVRSLGKGEVLIIGRKPVRFGGPYLFRPGGYVFRYTQAPRGSSGPARLRVTLESRRASRQQPYQLLVDTSRPRGRTAVKISGRLFVHVVTSSPSYVLRFTPTAVH